jgi:hypothetical protein
MSIDPEFAIMFAAAFSAFIPEPLMARQIQAAQKTREGHGSQNESGDPPMDSDADQEERT